MNKEIEGVEAKLVKYLKNFPRYDEELFNIGVELGRLLERNNISLHRPKIFVDFEEDNNAFNKRAEQISRANKAVAFIIRNAIAEHVENFWEFCFSKSRHSCTKLDESLVEKFGVQTVRTTQVEDGGSFEAEFELSGQVGQVLEKYGIDAWARADIDNTSGDEQEIIYSADDVDKIFGVNLRLNGRNTEFEYEQLQSLADELEQIVVWFKISLKNVH